MIYFVIIYILLLVVTISASYLSDQKDKRTVKKATPPAGSTGGAEATILKATAPNSFVWTGEAGGELLEEFKA